MVAGVGEQGDHLGPLGLIGLLEHPDERQGRFLLVQIGAQRLADGGLVAQHVQQVVGDVEGHAQVEAVLGQGVFQGRLGPGVMGASGSSRRSGPPSCRQ